MPFEVKDSGTPPRLRAAISAWLVFLAMLFGSILFSAIGSIVEDRVEDRVEPLAAEDERLAAHDLSAQRSGAPKSGVRKHPPISERAE